MIYTAANAPADSSGYRTAILNTLLQASHRLGAIALLVTLGTWAMIYLNRDSHVLLEITTAASAAGLFCGLIARNFTHINPTRSEASGVSIFNLVLLLLAIQLMLHSNLDGIRAAASDFFTPSPSTHPHG